MSISNKHYLLYSYIQCEWQTI